MNTKTATTATSYFLIEQNGIDSQNTSVAWCKVLKDNLRRPCKYYWSYTVFRFRILQWFLIYYPRSVLFVLCESAWTTLFIVWGVQGTKRSSRIYLKSTACKRTFMATRCVALLISNTEIRGVCGQSPKQNFVMTRTVVIFEKRRHCMFKCQWHGTICVPRLRWREAGSMYRVSQFIVSAISLRGTGRSGWLAWFRVTLHQRFRYDQLECALECSGTEYHSIFEVLRMSIERMRNTCLQTLLVVVYHPSFAVLNRSISYVPLPLRYVFLWSGEQGWISCLQSQCKSFPCCLIHDLANDSIFKYKDNLTEDDTKLLLNLQVAFRRGSPCWSAPSNLQTRMGSHYSNYKWDLLMKDRFLSNLRKVWKLYPLNQKVKSSRYA